MTQTWNDAIGERRRSLNWSRWRLAKEAGIRFETVQTAEDGTRRTHRATRLAIDIALQRGERDAA